MAIFISGSFSYFFTFLPPPTFDVSTHYLTKGVVKIWAREGNFYEQGFSFSMHLTQNILEVSRRMRSH